jgi:hypothetical protein
MHIKNTERETVYELTRDMGFNRTARAIKSGRRYGEVFEILMEEGGTEGLAGLLDNASDSERLFIDPMLRGLPRQTRNNLARRIIQFARKHDAAKLAYLFALIVPLSNENKEALARIVKRSDDPWLAHYYVSQIRGLSIKTKKALKKLANPDIIYSHTGTDSDYD